MMDWQPIQRDLRLLQLKAPPAQSSWTHSGEDGKILRLFLMKKCKNFNQIFLIALAGGGEADMAAMAEDMGVAAMVGAGDVAGMAAAGDAEEATAVVTEVRPFVDQF